MEQNLEIKWVLISIIDLMCFNQTKEWNWTIQLTIQMCLVVWQLDTIFNGGFSYDHFI